MAEGLEGCCLVAVIRCACCGKPSKSASPFVSRSHGCVAHHVGGCSSPPRHQSQQAHGPGEVQMNLLVEVRASFVDVHAQSPPTQAEAGSWPMLAHGSWPGRRLARQCLVGCLTGAVTCKGSPLESESLGVDGLQGKVPGFAPQLQGRHVLALLFRQRLCHLQSCRTLSLT